MSVTFADGHKLYSVTTYHYADSSITMTIWRCEDREVVKTMDKSDATWPTLLSFFAPEFGDRGALILQGELRLTGKQADGTIYSLARAWLGVSN